MFQLPRGTRDFSPNEMVKRRHIETNIRTTFQSFGYQEVQTPTFETLELFTAKSGAGIIDEIYAFTDKGGRELALRPELTAPVIRFFIDQLQMEPKPLKLFYFGNCFRYDRPQKGRYREFWQAGCELIGTDTPEGYAELIGLAFTILKNLGLKNLTINIGNLTIIDALFTKIKLAPSDRKYVLPLIDKAQFGDLRTALAEMHVYQEDINDLLNILTTPDITTIKNMFAYDPKVTAQISLLEQVCSLLKNSFDITAYQIKLSIVRGLDYYQGLVFEIDAPDLGAEKQLCGGGVYSLIPLFGGTDVPTAGFAIGFDRTLLALESENHPLPSSELDVYIIPVNMEMLSHAIQIAHQLRSLGVSADIDLLRRGVGKALKYANSRHAKTALIIGPQELAQQSATLRDMISGDQETIPLHEIIQRYKKK